MVPKKKKVTIYDVAQQAGCSYQTVSRVLNGNEKVAEETRQRILQAMEELGYVPNKIARTLITNRSRTLEFIVVDVIRGEQFADAIRNMALVAKSAGYDLLVTMASEENLKDVLENAAARLIDGVAMYAPSLHISDEKLLELCDGMPLVRRDYVADSRLAWVGFDQIRATRMAVEHLKPRHGWWISRTFDEK
jgi:LacI family transcriptional regulator